MIEYVVFAATVSMILTGFAAVCLAWAKGA